MRVSDWEARNSRSCPAHPSLHRSPFVDFVVPLLSSVRVIRRPRLALIRAHSRFAKSFLRSLSLHHARHASPRESRFQPLGLTQRRRDAKKTARCQVRECLTYDRRTAKRRLLT